MFENPIYAFFTISCIFLLAGGSVFTVLSCLRLLSWQIRLTVTLSTFFASLFNCLLILKFGDYTSGIFGGTAFIINGFACVISVCIYDDTEPIDYVQVK